MPKVMYTTCKATFARNRFKWMRRWSSKSCKPGQWYAFSDGSGKGIAASMLITPAPNSYYLFDIAKLPRQSTRNIAAEITGFHNALRRMVWLSRYAQLSGTRTVDQALAHFMTTNPCNYPEMGGGGDQMSSVELQPPVEFDSAHHALHAPEEFFDTAKERLVCVSDLMNVGAWYGGGYETRNPIVDKLYQRIHGLVGHSADTVAWTSADEGKQHSDDSSFHTPDSSDAHSDAHSHYDSYGQGALSSLHHASVHHPDGMVGSPEMDVGAVVPVGVSIAPTMVHHPAHSLTPKGRKKKNPISPDMLPPDVENPFEALAGDEDDHAQDTPGFIDDFTRYNHICDLMCTVGGAKWPYFRALSKLCMELNFAVDPHNEQAVWSEEWAHSQESGADGSLDLAPPVTEEFSSPSQASFFLTPDQYEQAAGFGDEGGIEGSVDNVFAWLEEEQDMIARQALPSLNGQLYDWMGTFAKPSTPFMRRALQYEDAE